MTLSCARLPEYQLRLVIADAIIEGVSEDGRRRRPTETEMVDKLWREDADTVRRIFREVSEARAGLDYERRRYDDDRYAPNIYGGAGPVVRTTKREKLWRKKVGLTVSAIAERTGIDKATLAALLEHHGFLEMVPYGGRQNRRLVSETAFHGEVGHNVTPENRIGHLEGYARAATFPVFYEDRLADVLWCLDYEGIKAGAVAQSTKRTRLAWLLQYHDYLPDAEIAGLARINRKTVVRTRAGQMSLASYIEGPQVAADADPVVNRHGGAYRRGGLTGRLIRLPSWAADRDATGPTQVRTQQAKRA